MLKVPEGGKVAEVGPSPQYRPSRIRRDHNMTLPDVAHEVSPFLTGHVRAPLQSDDDGLKTHAPLRVEHAKQKDE